MGDKHGNEKTYKIRAPSIKILEMQRAGMNFIYTHQKWKFEMIVSMFMRPHLIWEELIEFYIFYLHRFGDIDSSNVAWEQVQQAFWKMKMHHVNVKF